MNHANGKAVLVDTCQSFWQLAAIQLAGWTSMPVLATSILLLQVNSFLGSALTLIVGNAILWFIRLAIVFMSYKKKESTLDLSRTYFGNFGSYWIACLLLVSTFAWFIAQTTAASNTLTHLITVHENPLIDQFIQMSVLLGLLSTLLCMEGIVLVRYVSTIAFPLLLIAFIAILFSLPSYAIPNGRSLSFAGLGLVLSTNLGITADLPTFFRHSRSWPDSVKALTIVQLFILAFGLASLYLGAILNGMFEIDEKAIVAHSSSILRPSLLVFIFLSALTTNIANVYSASVGWEVLAPKALVGRKEYLILGLGLTIAFILLSNIFDPAVLLALSDFGLVNLCLILLAGFILGRILKAPPTPFQQGAYFIAWASSTAVNGFQIVYPFGSPLLTSLAIIAVCLAVYLTLKRLKALS